MNTFVEIVFADPITKASTKRLISLGSVNAIDVDANGRAVVVMAGMGVFASMQTGGSRLSTYEAYGDVAARIASATPTSPTATVSATDYNKATANQQATAQTAQANATPASTAQEG